MENSEKRRGEQLTESDIRKIEEEINYRKTELRPKLLENLKAARAMGDLSENFEYYVAKRENNQNNSRINYLDRMLRYAVVISDKSADDVVGMNNTVELYFEEDDETETYRIVTSIRGDSKRNLISNESPLGAAIMGHRVGDRVQVVVNDRISYYVVIKSIVNTGDSEDDRIKQY